MESNGIAVQTFAAAADFIESYRDGTAGCLVLDLKLPGMSGLELQEYLKQRDIEIPIVFVTGYGDVSAAVSALKGGAVDFIQKPFSHKDVFSVIEKAFACDAEMRQRRTRQAAVAGRLAGLTDREREVLQRIMEGKPNKIIAAELDISVKTIEFHRAKLMEKTGVTSVAELVRIALQQSE